MVVHLVFAFVFVARRRRGGENNAASLFLSLTGLLFAATPRSPWVSLRRQAKLASIAAPCVLFAGVLPRYIFYGSNRHEAPR